MTEHLSTEEYCHFLSYGDPQITNLPKDLEEIVNEWAHDLYDNHTQSAKDAASHWISTLESTTYPGMTFGYLTAPY